MSAAREKTARGRKAGSEAKAIEARVSLDDLRHRAEAVKSTAVEEAKGAVDAVMAESATRTLLIVAGVVVLTASVAFYLGSRAARASLDDLLGE